MNTNTTKIAILETEVKEIKEQNKIDHANILCEVHEIKQVVSKWIEEADRKYASKMVEKIIWGMAGALALWFLNQIFRIVEIH